MAKEKNNHMTLEDLALMVKRGFDQTATKEDIRQIREEMATKAEMDAGFFAVNRRIDLLHEDLSDLPDIREAVKDHDKRLARVEQKAGFAR